MNPTAFKTVLFLFLSLLTKHDYIHAMEPYQGQITQTKKSESINSCLCELCNTSFTAVNALKTHMKTHNPYPCNLCNKKFTTLDILKNHNRTHTGEKPYTCQVCNKSFANQANLTNHNRTHTGEKPYACTTCNKSFSDKSNYNRHIKTGDSQCTKADKENNPPLTNLNNSLPIVPEHIPMTLEPLIRKPYVCNKCGISYTKISSLTTHMNIHTDKKSYTDNICDKEIDRMGNLTIHTKRQREDDFFTTPQNNLPQLVFIQQNFRTVPIQGSQVAIPSYQPTVPLSPRNEPSQNNLSDMLYIQ